MRASSWFLLSCLVVGCAEPVTGETRDHLVLPPPITGDSCTPASGTYLSCDAALSATGVTSGCFTILSHGFASQPVARNCTLERGLVLQVYDGTTPPGTDQTYLDTVLDGLTSFVGVASYDRAVLELEVAGNQSLATAARWFPAAASSTSPTPSSSTTG